MKKLLSVLLVVLMLVGMLPMNAIHTHAAETTETLNIYGSTGTMSGTTSISWSTDSGVVFTNYKASSTTDIRTSDTSYYRVYANSEVEVTAPGNITKIVITSTGSSYNTPWVNSAGAIGTATNSGNVITVVPTTSAKTLKFSATAQVRLSSIEITYASADSGETYTVSFFVPEGVSSVADMECTGSGITLPTAGVPTGDHTYTFAGWTTGTVDNETTVPTIYKAGETFTATAATTLYALYTYSVAGEGTGSTEYVLTDIANIKATDEVVITMAHQSTVYALNSGNGTSSAPAATTVTVSNQKLSAAPNSNLIWNIETTSDGYIIYPNGTTDTWLYCTATNNGVRVGTNTANTFVVDASSGYLKHTGTSRYLGVYRSTPDWRCYNNTTGNTANQTLGFYVKSSGAASTTYYTTEISSTPAECTHENTTATTVNATCTAAGSTTVTCDDCGAVISETEIPATGHTTVVDAGKEPTCVNTGLTEGSHCSACNAVLVAQETIPATGEHTYVDDICSVCGAEEPTTGATEWQLVTDASTLAAGDKIVIVAKALDVALSITQNGNNRGQATVEKSTNTNSIEVVTFGDDVQVIALQAGTTDGTFAFYVEGDSTGYLYAASSGSNYLRTEGTLSANSSWEISIDSNGKATIKAQGSNTRNWLRYNSTNSIFSCYASGQGDVLIYKETIVCEHEKVVDVAEVPATCTTVGYTAGKQCAECGAYTEGHEEIPALGHSYGEGVVTTAPGCITTGVKTFTCSVCNQEKTEPISATGHLNTTETKADATCTVAGSITVTCDDCGAVISSTTIPAGHSWGEGEVTTEATCEEPGVMTYTCSVCKETKTEEIAALGHSWDEGKVTTKATCETDGVKTYTCTRDESHTKTDSIPATGHNYVNGVCSVCQKEVSCFQLVTDYTEILAGGEYIVAAKVGDSFYAINSASGTDWLTAQSVAVTIPEGGTGADMMIIYEDGLPIWRADYYNNRINCFSLYSIAADKYLAGTSGTGLTSSDDAWAWQFLDAYNGVTGGSGVQDDGEFAVTQSDGSVAFVAASATYLDRTITLNNGKFTHYSVRTGGYNRELYFFKMVEANETEYSVTFIENGITTITQSVPVDENVLKMPEPTSAAMPEGYTKFVGWVTLPHMESLIAPATIYSAEQTDGGNNTAVITEDTTFYALYSREDPDAEGQALSYHRVTNTNQLVVGEKYIIVGLAVDGGYWAMSKDQLSDDRGASSVVPDENGVITFLPENNVAVFELAQGHEIGSYAFLDLAMNMFLYCSSSDSNASLKSQATLDSAASFVIDILKDENTGYYSTINANVGVNRSYLMFNTIRTEDRLFSCYALYADTDSEGNLEQNTFLYVGVPNSTFATYYTTGLCVHDWVLKESQTASCTQPGYKMYVCSICGEIKMEDVKAHGHDVGESDVTVEPTCTTTGLATSTCNKCGEEFTETIPALGHTEVVDDAVAASCTETGLTEGKHCSVCDTVLVPQQVAPALGHDFDAAKGTVDDTGNCPVVVYPCSRCDETHIAAELKFTNASLTLENNIVVNFKAPANVMGEGEYTGFSDLRAEFTYGNRIGENMIKATSAEIVQQADGKYSVPCRRVTPSQIGDEITATLYGTFGGTEYSFEMKYSAAEYCYAMLKETTDTKLQTLLVDLLYFCDAAREYTTYQGVDKDYKYYGSVTRYLSDVQKTFRTTAQPTCESVMGVSKGEYAVTWQSASLIIGDTTSIQFTVNMGSAELTKDMIRVTVGEVTYTDVDCRPVGDVWQIRVFGLAAHQMRETVQVTLCSGDVAISQTVSYSIESYVARNMENSNTKLVDMLIAMMKYGDAAVAYKG